MDNPLVTVFMPVYNCEKYIRESLESILNQTYKNIDFLIIDDGSTDKSVEIIKNYNDPRVRLLCNRENKGIPYTRDKGLKNANGIYFALMDADDIAKPNRIEEQVEFLNNNRDAVVVASYYETVGRKINRVVKSYCTSEEIKIALLFKNVIGNPTSMIRLSSINENKIEYNGNFFVAQDYDLWAQISKVGEIYTIPKVLLNYRVGHENITKKSQTSKSKERRHVISNIHNDLLEFYKFKLNDKEKIRFNEIFDDNDNSVLNIAEINEIKLVLEKLIYQNKQNNVLNHEKFCEIMNESAFKRISSCSIKLKDKVQIYKTLIHRNSLKRLTDILFIYLKCFYDYIK